MREFTHPLETRRRRCEAEKARYWASDEYRLRSINRARVHAGYPPRASLAEVAPRRGGEA